MKALLITLSLSLIILLAHAQTTISGILTTKKGNPLAKANLSIKNSYDGTTTDNNGRFSFTTTETGNHILQFSAFNYETDSIRIELKNTPVTVNFSLKEAVNELETVGISAGYIIAGDGKKGAVLTSLDIATTAGANADIFAAQQTMPGTQAAFSENGLFVRGGTAAETKTYFDGMLVKSPFNATVPDQASRGRLSAFLFKGTSFSSGGYSAQYGQALSSALILESKDLPEKTTTGISLLTVGTGIDQNIRFKNSAFTIGGYYYNLKPIYHIIKQENEYVKAPEQLGANIHYKWKTSASGMFKVYAAYSATKLAVFRKDADHPDSAVYFSNHNSNVYINSTYKAYLGNQWKIEAGFSYNRDKDQGILTADDYTRQDHLSQGKITLTNYFGRLSDWKTGAETFNTGRRESLNGQYRSYQDQLSAAFAESDLFLTSKLVLRLGGRAEYSSYLANYNLAPRTSIGIKTGGTAQVSFAYGRFFQNPEDEYLVLQKLNYERADHYILKYEINPNERNFRIEGYYKNYRQLTREESGKLNNSGSGYAKGFEVFWKDKKSIRNADYYISYSFLDTRRIFRDFPVMATPSFAAKHTATAVYKHFINSLQTQVGGTYSFASGRPYVNPNSTIYLSDRTKNYNSLSLTLSHLTHILGQFTVLYVNANNVTGFQNIYGYQYSSDGMNRRAIVPGAKRDLIVGLLMTIGDNTFVR
jgi:hypothetical protein